MPCIIKIEKATVKQQGKTVFDQLEFEWSEGQHWAVIGDSGLRLTSFLDTMLGRTMVTSGTIIRPFSEDYQKTKAQSGEINSFRDLISTVNQQYVFRNKSNLQNFYYQQRFNSMESDDTATVVDYLNDMEVKVPGFWNLQKVLDLMRLNDLGGKSLIKLSNGETRRLAIAAALIKNPKLLLMDQPMTGLDIQSRTDFGRILKEIANSGIHIMLTAHSDEIPEPITHVAVLADQKVNKIIKVEELKGLDLNIDSGNEFDHLLIKELLGDAQKTDFNKILEMENVNVRYGDRKILDNINWTVLPNSKWLLKGENGAGKSTLLSLILGENPQAYSNNFWLFDRKRGTGESIWDIKKNIGFVAPELSRFFPSNQTCLKVVLSGLFDTMGLFKKVSPEQEKTAISWLKLFRLEGSAHLLLRQVSLENQRFVLLARALIKKPVLLVLDEASQGMDELQRKLFRKTIDQVCRIFPVSIIYVSHYEEDIPACVDKVLELSYGKVVEIQ